jgi:hypothetical protein
MKTNIYGKWPTKGAVISILIFSVFIFIATSNHAFAAVSDWQKGAIIYPRDAYDFQSDNFKQALQNLKATGANAVELIVRFHQTDFHSVQIGRGFDTPTDDALGFAIDYAHSLGMSVLVRHQVVSDDGVSGAYFAPSDRNLWFANYGKALTNTAKVAEAHHAEIVSIGTEMSSLTTLANPDNTYQWRILIDKVHFFYHGKLTYIANSSPLRPDDPDQIKNEKRFIGFWNDLDYVALSPYYSLNSPNNSIDNLKAAWDYWNINDLKLFVDQGNITKPILFADIGYRSISGSYYDPRNAFRQGSVDETTQANAYQALLSYWDNYAYVAGTYFYNWDTSPFVSNGNNTLYNPQNKLAQSVMRQWFKKK